MKLKKNIRIKNKQKKKHRLTCQTSNPGHEIEITT